MAVHRQPVGFSAPGPAPAQGSDPGVATYSDGFHTASNTEAGKRPIIVFSRDFNLAPSYDESMEGNIYSNLQA